MSGSMAQGRPSTSETLTVEIVISTCNARIKDVESVLLPPMNGVSYLIVHQVFDGKDYSYDDNSWLQRRDVRIVSCFERGLANSRNLGLQHATGDIVVPTDDDVRFLGHGSMTGIKEAFQRYPHADVITFVAVDENGEERRQYPKGMIRHTRWTITGVSSIEIAIRRRSIAERRAGWDPEFGLNQRYGGALENAFMSNVLAKGLVALFIRREIVRHPRDASGMRYTLDTAKTKGAIFSKIFGPSGVLWTTAFCFKNYLNIRREAPFGRYLWVAIGASITYNVRRLRHRGA